MVQSRNPDVLLQKYFKGVMLSLYADCVLLLAR